VLAGGGSARQYSLYTCSNDTPIYYMLDTIQVLRYQLCIQKCTHEDIQRKQNNLMTALKDISCYFASPLHFENIFIS